MLRTLSTILRHARLVAQRRDRVLVLVPQGGTVDAYLFAVRPDEHRVSIIETDLQASWGDFAPLRPTLAQYLPPVVIATPTLRTATLSVPVSFDRPNAHGPVRAQEFQDVLKRLQVSLWAEQRPRIAEALGVDPIDAVLASFRLESVRVQGSEVLNPTELMGNYVELDVLVRFVARDIFDRSLEATPSPFFADPAWRLVTGGGAVAPAVLFAHESPAVLVADRPHTGGMHEIVRLPLSWSPADVARELELRWGVSREVATRVLAQHVGGATMGTVHAGINDAVASARAALDAELRATRLSGELPVVSDIPIPASPGQSAVRLVPLVAHRVLQGSGLEFEGDVDPRAVAAFAEFYYSERYNELNAWLRQRISWLGTASSV